MSLQTDCDLATVTAATQWDDVTFNGTFDNAPVDTVVMSTTDKKKSALQEGQVTTTGAKASAEVTQIRYLSKEPGYDAGAAGTHPEMDSGTLQVAVTKILEAVSFNSTFSNAPIVVTGYYGGDTQYKGGKNSCANITTTGCDVATEIKASGDNVNWIAMYTGGFWEAS